MITAIRTAAARTHIWLSRFAAYRVFHTLVRLGTLALPKWLRWLPVAAALIPGPQDELLLILIVAIPLLATRARRAETFAAVASAWMGV